MDRVSSATASWKADCGDRRRHRRALLTILASAPWALAGRGVHAQGGLSTPPGTSRQAIARSAELDVAHDLGADGAASARERKPILLFFDRRGCPYCERALREYLVPMSRETWRDRAIFRQIDIDRPLPVTDFDGSASTHDRIAARHGVRFSPTVIVVGHDGGSLASPIVGLLSVDFYGAYLERALEDAERKLSGRPL